MCAFLWKGFLKFYYDPESKKNVFLDHSDKVAASIDLTMGFNYTW